MPADKPTRVAIDLLTDAAVEGRKHNRSAKQQLEHWARVGRTVSARASSSRLRVEAVLRGDLLLSELAPEEAVVANAELDVAIADAASAASFGGEMAARGVTTVALDAEGRLVEHRPDGSTHLVG